jgi:hypothetical protein
VECHPNAARDRRERSRDVTTQTIAHHRWYGWLALIALLVLASALTAPTL